MHANNHVFFEVGETLVSPEIADMNARIHTNGMNDRSRENNPLIINSSHTPSTCGEVDISVAEDDIIDGLCNAYTCLCCSKRKHTDPEPNHDRRSPYLNWGGGDGSGD